MEFDESSQRLCEECWMNIARRDCRESVGRMKTSRPALTRRRNTIYQDHLPFITDTPAEEQLYKKKDRYEWLQFMLYYNL